ncbi:cysteine hydrolase family protein [Peribacillus loiseleuriae]|uniref:Isochorismatase n=1 Tax=Peribacillus loiseleuriae TaxID=1679170 RepID=A0A0K9GUL3_9BACI|nr:cysteine hydrolase family protein [Peribacillus loiseleuriae]KMY49932.1 isochorismatase [Peribacillus loiseleuriae]
MQGNQVALLIVDVQIGSFREIEPLYKAEELLKNIRLLISNARKKHIPIVYMKFNDKPGKPLERGTSGWDIHPFIAPTEEDTILEKNHPDSFHETNLQQELAIRGVKRIVITGIQTEVCVDATCRHAFSLGYDVVLVKDGHTTYDSEILMASQIINHHNKVLHQWFANVKELHEIEF